MHKYNSQRGTQFIGIEMAMEKESYVKPSRISGALKVLYPSVFTRP